MKKFLVIGNPVEHSLSPKLHNYWIKKNNISAIYGKLKANVNDFQELRENLKKKKLNGLNITVPFKKDIIPYIDILSGDALRTNSVNTISVDDGKLVGHNTDIDGFELSIKNIKYCVKIAKKFYETEASGNVTLKTVKAIASTGVNRISIGSITHSAPAIDYKLEI